jgi:cytochrome c oxidase cbb3-type subunit 4
MANLFTDASSLMTVISFFTFVGILGWTFGIKRCADFEAAAHLPFADETDDAIACRISQCLSQRISQNTEQHHG